MCVVFWIPIQSCNMTPNFQFRRCRSCHSWHKELCTHILLSLPYPVCLLDVPKKSKRPYTSERKDNKSWTVMKAATNWATHTTAFLTRRLPVASRTGRTEYQLLLMKASVIVQTDRHTHVPTEESPKHVFVITVWQYSDKNAISLLSCW